MDIYLVQPGDTIYGIAAMFGVQADKLIQDNGLDDPGHLASGQAIVITYPELIYTVQEGDSLTGIANAYSVTPMQLLRNNPSLSGRESLYPGEILTIRYHTNGQLRTNGFVYPYVNKDILQKTLPELTYLTVINYQVTENGGLVANSDDTDIIRTAKDYGTVPLMMTSSFSLQGQPNMEAAFNILLNEEYQERHISNIVDVLKSKGYSGVNMTFNYMNTSNQSYYEKFITKAADQIHKEGFLFFITINPKIDTENNQISFEKIDISKIGQVTDHLIFLQFIFGSMFRPPGPVFNISQMQAYLEYIASQVPNDKISVGCPVLGYDWRLPYIQGRSNAYSLTMNAALNLAYSTSAVIRLDEGSQSPYFIYNSLTSGTQSKHIVWFIDARSFGALRKLISQQNLSGTGIWNIMTYSAPFWLIVNSNYDIAKDLPVNTDVLSKMCIEFM